MIWVCHNNRLVREMLRDHLGELGHEVQCLGQQEMLSPEVWNGSSPEVLILGVFGFDPETKRRLKEIHTRSPGTYILAMVSTHSRLSAEEALDCGIRTYLREPLLLPEVEMALRNLNGGNGQ